MREGMLDSAATARHHRDHPDPGARVPAVSLPRVVVSEWTKLRSLRSTWWVLAIVLVLSWGIGALIASAISDPTQSPPGGGPAAAGLFDPVASVLAGTSLAALVIGVLGALTVSGEYATGSITASFSAVPRRWPVLLAKVLVLIAVVVPVASAVSAGALWVGGLVLGEAATISWTDGTTLGAVAGTAGYLTAIALLGLALGVLLRSSAAAITVLVALVFVLPVLMPILSYEWTQTVASHLPGSAGQSLQATRSASLSDAEATWTLLAWTLLPLALSAWVLQRRDA